MVNDALVEGIIESLWKLREVCHDTGSLNPDRIGYIDDDIDCVEVGYLKRNPDGDYQNQLHKEGFSIDRDEAIELLKVRFNNTLDACL